MTPHSILRDRIYTTSQKNSRNKNITTTPFIAPKKNTQGMRSSGTTIWDTCSTILTGSVLKIWSGAVLNKRSRERSCMQ